MTPEQIMAAFEERGPLPRAALRAAGESRDAMAPLFLDHIDRLLEVDVDVFDEDLAFIFIYHLLAEWRETRAYRPMARLLRRDPEFVDALMGDGITECVARVMASLFDGDLGADSRGGPRRGCRPVRPRADARRPGDPRARPSADAAGRRRLPAAVPYGGRRDDAGYRVVSLGFRGRGPRSGRHDAARPPALRRRADRADRLDVRGLRERSEGDARDRAIPSGSTGAASAARSPTPSPSSPPGTASRKPASKPSGTGTRSALPIPSPARCPS